MKKIIAGMLMFSCVASVNAAQVSFSSGSTPTPNTNEVNGFALNSDEYKQRVTDFALVSPEANNGEELIYLGVYQNIDYAAAAVNTINVDLQNINLSQTNTGAVSLVLTGGRQMTWNLTWDTSVALNSIVLFSLDDAGHSLIINDTTVDFSDMSNSDLGLDIKHSEIPICGYALPQNSMNCRTDRLLGINRDTTDFMGFVTSTNGANVNYLADETALKVTSFNGAYEANDFVVGIDTAAVPLPGALLLFSSSLCLVFIRSKAGNNKL